MSAGDLEPQLWTLPEIHSARLQDAAEVNERILAAFANLTDEDFTRRTHFFGGRFENLYLDRRRIPELQRVLDFAEARARLILGWHERPLRCGFWFNAQGPGQSTSEHTHAELDELLSGVYYLKVPKESGDIVLREGPLSLRVTPLAGMFLFIPPELSHSVEINRSDELRVSLAFNFGPMQEDETDGSRDPGAEQHRN